jgi:hypothetical protein
MRAEGFALDAGFPALHRIHARGRFRAVGSLSFSEAAADRLLVLHHPLLLGSADELQQLLSAVDRVQRFAPELRAASHQRPAG